MARIAIFPIVRWAFPVLSLVLIQVCLGQTFKSAEIVEYRVRGTNPPQWEFGVVVRPLDGGKQYVILQKPTRFSPQGAEAIFDAVDVRAPQIPKVGGNPADPKVPGDRLLSKQDVIAYAKQVFGPGDPFADSNVRQIKVDQIRDFIKARGTDFLSDLDFENKEMPPGMLTIHIKSAIVANHGKHPRLEDYISKFRMGRAKRGVVTRTPEGQKVVVSPEESLRTEPGTLIIEKTGTYVWILSRDHAPEMWVRGKWREVRPDELHLWEGGPAIWLEKAHEGRDYMARMCREPNFQGWLEVGEAKARTSMQYGRPD